MHKSIYLIGAIIAVAVIGSFALYNMPSNEATLNETKPDSMNQGAIPDANTQQNTWAIDYTPEALENARVENDLTILFFHANWCPTCRAAANDFAANAQDIPENVQIVKVNYDTASELKKEYTITTQHTFVAIDSQGNEVARWVGGELELLQEKVAEISQ